MTDQSAVTWWVCICGAIGLTLYDLVAYQVGGLDGTVSRWMQRSFYRAGVVLGVGVILGHALTGMPVEKRSGVASGVRGAASVARPVAAVSRGK